jgi:hypothetical protein
MITAESDAQISALQEALGAAVERVRELEGIAAVLNERISAANDRADRAEQDAAALQDLLDRIAL